MWEFAGSPRRLGFRTCTGRAWLNPSWVTKIVQLCNVARKKQTKPI